MNEKITFIAIGVTTLIIVIAASFLLTGPTKPGAVTPVLYTASDAQKPRVSIQKTSTDLGNIKVSDEKSADYVLKNSGTKPLQLSGITTSCMCTFGQIIYKNSKSDEFGMHSQSSYIAEIPPGESAVLRVIYRPYLMPVYGEIEREVYVNTNDPATPKLVFSVTANVH